ncbi:hypothetical protein DFS34DRAFT_648806 [Phlyctochytrium arcticum]|nr:hypothetical protein DFS34DRAFT_648806 [Phlyctochytrium arcticum]
MPAAVAPASLPVPHYYGGPMDFAAQQQQQPTSYNSARIALGQLGLQLQQPTLSFDPAPARQACSAGPSPQKHARTLAHVTSLEKTIEYIQKEHSSVLQGLHAEIHRLQTVCADLSMRLVTGQNGQEAPTAESVKTIMSQRARLPNDEGRSAEGGTNGHISHDKDDASVSEPQLYILLDQQRKKYAALLDRLNDDNKRKQAEIDHLKAERKIVKEALAVAGLRLDAKELHALTVAASAPGGAGGAAMKSKSKNPPLPPIGKSLGPIDREKFVEQIPEGRAKGDSERAAAPTPPPTSSDESPRPPSRTRASKPMFPIPSAAEQQPPARNVLDPPMNPQALSGSDIPLVRSHTDPQDDTTESGGASHTTWFNRVAGTKLVRQKQWKDMKTL